MKKEEAQQMHIGIITFHASYNFGSALQTYALQMALKAMGHTPCIIDYRAQDFDQYLLLSYKHPRQTLKTLLNFPRYFKRMRAFETFKNRYFNLTKRHYTYKNEQAMSELQNQFDCFICGGDQIWNLDATKGVVEPFFLSFAGDRKKVAYAPSLAHASFKSEYFNKEKVAGFLKEFDAISVRERETIDLFQSLVDKKIEVTVDPTMLQNASAYEPLFSERISEDPYIFVYLLRDCPELVKSASEMAERTGKKVFYVAENNIPITNSDNLFGAGPGDFLSLIAHADAVLTNSFHATVFSLKFHRPFRVFATDLSSSRIHDPLEGLDLENCLAFEVDSSPLLDVDWVVADERMAGARNKSLRFLREALV